MGRTLGWDIGGAFVRAALASDGRVLKVWQIPIPIARGRGAIEQAIDSILGDAGEISRHTVTLTGEIADSFADRKAGVEQLSSALHERLGDDLFLYAGRSGWLSGTEVTGYAEDIASASWHASASLAAEAVSEALFIDMGSSSTDIAPIAEHRVRAAGYTERERLVCGELVPQGFVRTPVMAVADVVPFGGRSTPVLAVDFATMEDAQRLLGTLEETGEPPEDDSAALDATSRARLARMVGMDVADASPEAWSALAAAFAEAQLRHVQDAALLVLSRCDITKDAPIVVAGAGRPVLRRLAARLDRGVIDFADLVDCPSGLRDAVCLAAPAAAVALLGGND
ncbi:hydantoinase/oxoprolinase family protein [Consotaella salsifontis]|uniref:Probable H4MPT-linked C1 transfer pathway protein n=1 Tax=Consotaella salsifontis TaxID=1365950 RepID=A0A1T4SRN6_9HYPH|nr:hydantoinase/oxoprolinase family protein [Consotaella salsifontis]SKA30823.1 probable H4MPT-linked C1 transfer pathway protein [Consotaella salsifontis]